MRRMDEKGVSPVIGVILMVAITVILAAVIASFVFGMGTSVKKTYNVAVTAQQSGSNIIITVAGGPDVSALSYLNITCIDSGGASDSLITQTATAWVGAVFTCVNKGTPGADRVIVVGHFADGTEQIILDTTV
uniref:Type IV pilin n=1 Tax=candidate division WOR-3 bacterium TaxID=2052148 RepID=A0A7V3ZWH8_UNCW3